MSSASAPPPPLSLSPAAPAPIASGTRKTGEKRHAAGSESISVNARKTKSHAAEIVVTRKTIDRFVPGTNPMKALARTTPGATFTSSDAFGLDLPANTFYVRGFTQLQLGATLDGIPLGSQGYPNQNGVSITQAMIQDDIAGMTLSQGAGALDIFSAQLLGGALTYTSSDPADRAGGRLSQTFGSSNAFRTYARADSGVLNATGSKFYASFARTENNLWKGEGYQRELQADAKFVQPIHEKATLTGFFGYGNFMQANYLPLTLNMWRRMGRDTTFLKPDYEKAKLWAYYAQYTSQVPPGYEGILSHDEAANYAWDGSQIQRSYLSSLSGRVDLTKKLRSDTVLYGNVNSAIYGGTNNFVTSPSYGVPYLRPDNTVSGVPMALQRNHADMRRVGFTQKLSWEAPHRNLVQTGLWYESNRWIYDVRLYEDTPSAAHSMMSGLRRGTGSTWFENSYNTNTFQFFLQDRWRILPGMTLLAGFKALTQTTHGGTKRDDTRILKAEGWNAYYRRPAKGALTASAAFLPHFSFDYHLDDRHELYWDIAENMRAYDYYSQASSGTAWGGLGNASQPAQQVFDANRKILKPERSWTYVVGYRYTDRYFTGTVDYYHTDYFNRLASITEGASANTRNAYLNVGRETMDGADVLASLRPVRALEITNSFSWNDARYQGTGINYGGRLYNLKGKRQVYYPSYMYKTGLSYDWRGTRLSFDANYISARPMTFMNDLFIPPYWVADLSVVHDFGRLGFVEHLTGNFGITNLLDTNYIGGIYGAASVRGDNNANLYVAAPRQFFGTLSARF
ncbi:TonB-dependent receptor domain-containing protein [Swaminathania salitolerans]|nr:TonB-dependent receptor [Swaminathania salitolerans]